ncbi:MULTISPECIES: MBL fold metallo-hydrolase [Stenotrophomonas]|jgi:glyoxylase-like metal-dependent hydrolase (beta-lactamase superfamily II)|uniref:MBL fold metallo-hydrolase n=1 Tax=Stenotrophomonas TaxID=40323 RepID=UPI00081C7DF4|nr:MULTISPECIES: MBL fold metallo-hydrolase [Stenotrophomonas]AOA73738.1 Beta-lactamase domain-containing protein [Stenotrophomonas rhizophila]MDQ1061318.1 glyoxylase-like metal-dependent hydrolase (beta-lactamase superfamily II) [Stenotrophomonas sp. SORGH_AS_0282]MDQ1190333.1 glyoxylase-like metal-dependent hydrolase (beta-lactamase superfamily II) [Stenotrophomonas sp. SORGH_AS_0282]UQY87228.1 MBL fold metallo-hydrolase [Stenotrophomonas rhizophila]
MFTLENTVAPPPPALDELVPSRYALKVGDIDVLVVSDGVLPLPTQMLGHNVSAAERAPWFKEMYLPPDALDWALNVMVVRSGDRNILIDAGLGMDPDLNLPRAGQLIRRLGASGINLGEITDVVITHLHMDHIGGLLVDGVKEQLHPELRIHVAAAEVEFWKAPDFTRTNMPPGFPDALRATATHFLAEYGSYVRTFDEVHEIAPGVTAHRTGGHTPGHSVVRLNSNGEALTFAGDAIFAVGFEQPNWHNGFEHDPEGAAQVRITLLNELAGTGEMLVATHLPFPSVGRVSADGDVFRWVPVFWDF